MQDRDKRRPALSRSPADDAPAQRGNRGGGSTGPGGGLGMSRLDTVVRVLKAAGKALHYDIITRQALKQGMIRFSGSQGTAGESMMVCCHPPAYQIGRAPPPCPLLTMARTRSCALSMPLTGSCLRLRKQLSIHHEHLLHQVFTYERVLPNIASMRVDENVMAGAVECCRRSSTRRYAKTSRQPSSRWARESTVSKSGVLGTAISTDHQARQS